MGCFQQSPGRCLHRSHSASEAQIKMAVHKLTEDRNLIADSSKVWQIYMQSFVNTSRVFSTRFGKSKKNICVKSRLKVRMQLPHTHFSSSYISKMFVFIMDCCCTYKLQVSVVIHHATLLTQTCHSCQHYKFPWYLFFHRVWFCVHSTISEIFSRKERKRGRNNQHSSSWS